MVPAFNEILFLLSTLFGLNTVFFAEQTKLTLDLELKTGTIEYLDLNTLTQAVEYAAAGLKKIDNSAKFNEHFGQLKLDSKIIEKKNGKLNARLTFSFDDQNEVLKLLRFNVNQYGQSTSSDAIYYHLLPSEQLINSNGMDKKLEDTTVLKWAKDTKAIIMDLMQKENSTGLMGETQSIVEYWKK